MTDAYIYDAVRTPRGKGRKKDGALADATPLHLAKTVLRRCPRAARSTARPSTTSILGCVEPVMEQGANIGRTRGAGRRL
jgi:acetyl-CoA C-acetyltransferase